MRVTEAVSDDDRVIRAAVIDHIRTHRMSESTLAVAVGTRLGITYVSVLPVIDDMVRDGTLTRLGDGHVARSINAELDAVYGAIPDLPDGFPEPAPIRLPTPEGSHISNLSITIEQDGDTWQSGSDGQYLRITVPPAEDDGHYAVLRTKRWAVNDGNDLRKLADLVDAVIGVVGR